LLFAACFEKTCAKEKHKPKTARKAIPSRGQRPQVLRVVCVLECFASIIPGIRILVSLSACLCIFFASPRYLFLFFPAFNFELA